MSEENASAVEPEDQESTESTGGMSEPDYADIIDDLGTEPTEPEPEVVEPETPAEPQDAAPPEEKATQPTEPAQPATTPAEPQAQTNEPPAAPEAPVQPETKEEPKDPAGDFDQEKFLGELTNQLVDMYKLSEEEAAKVDDLESKPSEYLPRLMAGVHLNAFQSIWNSVNTILPQVIEQTVQQQTQRNAAEGEFFNRWPDLKEHRGLAAAAADFVRRQQPKLSRQELIEKAGAIAMAQLGKAPAAVQQAQPRTETVLPPTPVVQGESGSVNPRQLTKEQEAYAQMVDDEFL